MNYEALGQRIREGRKKQNMTQSELAKAIGRSCSYCGHLERGLRIPSLETLVHISQALSMPLHFIVLGKGGDHIHIGEVLTNIQNVLTLHAEEWLP